MKTISLEKTELEALSHLICNSRKCCSCGCIISEMQKSKKDCDDCKFTKSVESIADKIGFYE